MMYQLICEGVCNPNLAYADQLVDQFMTAKHRELPFTDTDAMLKLQRALRYTTHTSQYVRTAVCTQCSHERSYGSK